MIEELEALTILAATPYLGSVKISLLLQVFGSAQEVLQVKAPHLSGLRGFGPKICGTWGWWQGSDRWKSNLEAVARQGVELIPFTSANYPPLLKAIGDPPVVLYVKGKLPDPSKATVAVVGSRTTSIYGMEMAMQVAAELTGEGIIIVSGLARGIDTQAHQATLENKGETLAVIGSGLGNLYPRENQQLAALIADNGALISEYPMATPPDKQNFPQRNRIISGLSLATVLIQSPARGGAMLTMCRAKQQKRRTFALPGRADSSDCMGNLALIKNGDATLILSGKEVASALFGDDRQQSDQVTASPPPVTLSDEERQLLATMPDEEASIEHIGLVTELPIRKLHVLLMSLLLKRVVREYPGKVYKKLIYKELS